MTYLQYFGIGFVILHGISLVFLKNVSVLRRVILATIMTGYIVSLPFLINFLSLLEVGLLTLAFIIIYAFVLLGKKNTKVEKENGKKKSTSREELRTKRSLSKLNRIQEELLQEEHLEKELREQGLLGGDILEKDLLQGDLSPLETSLKSQMVDEISDQKLSFPTESVHPLKEQYLNQAPLEVEKEMEDFMKRLHENDAIGDKLASAEALNTVKTDGRNIPENVGKPANLANELLGNSELSGKEAPIIKELSENTKGIDVVPEVLDVNDSLTNKEIGEQDNVLLDVRSDDQVEYLEHEVSMLEDVLYTEREPEIEFNIEKDNEFVGIQSVLTDSQEQNPIEPIEESITNEEYLQTEKEENSKKQVYYQFLLFEIHDLLENGEISETINYIKEILLDSQDPAFRKDAMGLLEEYFSLEAKSDMLTKELIDIDLFDSDSVTSDWNELEVKEN
ncbi:SSA_2305 family type IV pilus system protein [Granulicatella seriolae]|uniref:MFS transporter n=1 Tax=Granulicatella seriolae TaxID=2967226 RepID=A0ABT1WL80_9LACT|nr:hypothetical protein [Granulicatella seriolae]